MNTPDKTRHDRQRGNASIETALLLPILVSLFIGTFSFGYAYYIYAELEAAVRGGARYASLSTYDATNPDAFQTAVQNMVTYGKSDSTSQPVVAGLQTSNVNVAVGFARNEPTSVTVSISGYKIPGMLAYGGTLTNKPSLQIPFLGHYLP